MARAILIRLLLAVGLAITSGGADAQTAPPTNFPGPIQPQRSNDSKVIWYVVGGIAAAAIGWVIGTRVFGDPGKDDPPVRTTLPPTTTPPLDNISLPQTGGQNLPAPKRGPNVTTARLRNGFNLPPVGETRFVQDEVLLDIPSSVSERALNLIAAQHNMTRLETKTLRLTGRTLHRWRLDGGGTVSDMISGMSGVGQVAGAQPLYLFELTQDTAEPVNSDQYAPEKLNLVEAHRLATGNRVLVAVIDSGVDTAHPDLAGAITASFDATGEGAAPHPHGTGMAGAIAAHRTMLGTAPRVGLLTVRAFGAKSGTVEATTFNIIKGLDWAAEQGARVVNMSFAGPSDPRLHDALAKATKKGMVLIAAAGNAGPRSPPLFPGADPNVIAVTATDSDDALFPGANRGSYISVAAPGVDVLVPGPGATYQLTTGTSVASAEVSGVAALLIERNPKLTPADVRRILTRTAKTLGGKGREKEFGAGLVNAYGAVSAARSGAISATSAGTGTGTASTARP